MRKKILILASLALGFIATSCQDDKNVFHEIDDAITRSELAEHEITDYYWYRDNKIPIKQAPKTLTASHPAVIATKPAKEPFNDIATSGLPYLIQVTIMTVQVANAGATVVVAKMVAN